MRRVKLLPFSAVFLFAFYLPAFSPQYRISSVNFSSEGLTRESALKRNIKIEEGKIFGNEEELNAYIVDIKQRLINARLFESAQVEYAVTEDAEQEEEIIPVAINVSTVDSKHFLFLPYPKYDSNEGFEIKTKLKDSNFLGTMSEMSADIFFQFENKPSQSKDYVLGGSLEYNLPFTIGRVEASWNNDWEFKYAFVRRQPEWDLKTGFTFVMPFKKFDLRLDLMQGSAKEPDYAKFDDEIYFSEYAKFSVPVRLLSIKGFGDLVYTPAVDVLYNWDKNGIDSQNEDLLSPTVSVINGISLGRIDWHGNFRKGLLASAEQVTAYNARLNEWRPGASAKVQAFWHWKYAGINSRLTIFGQYNSYRRYGHLLRGIPDDQYFAAGTGFGDTYACKSTGAIILNLDFPIHVFTTDWEKIGWNKLKSFNFEVQISPFIDIALTQNRITGRVFDPRDGFYTCGIELLVFPEKWHSVQLRASAGFDLSRLLFKNAVDTSWRDAAASTKEFSIGIGLFY